MAEWRVDAARRGKEYKTSVYGGKRVDWGCWHNKEISRIPLKKKRERFSVGRHRLYPG